MICVGARAITKQFRNRNGASPQCVLQFFYDQYAGPFPHDKTISSDIERAGCLCGMIIKAGGHCSCGGECAQADPVNAGLGAATHSNIGFAGANQARRVANSLCTGSTCGNRCAQGATKTVADGNLPGCHIGQKTGNSERRKTPGPTVIRDSHGIHNCAEPAYAGRHNCCRPFASAFSFSLPAGLVQSLLRCSHGKQAEPVHLLLVPGFYCEGCIESPWTV